MPEYDYRPLPKELYIGTSSIEGNGLFTLEFLDEGKELGITHVKHNSSEFDSNSIRTPLGGFMNHSETPNCILYECGDYLKLRTSSNIKAGKELTISYGLYGPCKNYKD